MTIKNIFTRKSFLLRALGMIGGVITASIPGRIPKLFSAVDTRPDSTLIVVTCPDLSEKSIKAMVHKGFENMGGINKFIKKGMNVVIKPNMAWNSAPERAHTTNPFIVEEVTKMCVNAGAKVTVFDRTCNSAKQSYISSGIAEAAEKAGAKVEYIDDRKFTLVKVPGALKHDTLPVYKPVLDADFVINIPILKHHSSSEITISMKNLMGVIGGNRGAFHLNLHESIVDFAKAVKADLIICDATRILTANGPNGGTPEDIRDAKTLIMGTNTVTVDAYAASLFGRRPEDIEYIALAGREKMGEIRPERMNILKNKV